MIVLFEAALVFAFIRFVFALSLTITVAIIGDTITIGTGPFSLWVAAASLAGVGIEALEAALLVAFIRFILALGFTIADVCSSYTITVFAGNLGIETSTSLIVVEAELLEAASIITLIGFIGALGLAITVLLFLDTVTVVALYLSLLITTALLRAFVRIVSAVMLLIAEIFGIDALAVLALPLVFLAATSLVVVEGEFPETALVICFIRFVSTLGFAVTVGVLWNTVTVGARPFGFWIATTDFGAIGLKALVAAFSVGLIRSIRALSFTIADLILLDTVTIGTLPFIFLTTANLTSKGLVALEAAK
jgi:hypothetical protein